MTCCYRVPAQSPWLDHTYTIGWICGSLARNRPDFLGFDRQLRRELETNLGPIKYRPLHFRCRLYRLRSSMPETSSMIAPLRPPRMASSESVVLTCKTASPHQRFLTGPCHQDPSLEPAGASRSSASPSLVTARLKGPIASRRASVTPSVVSARCSGPPSSPICPGIPTLISSPWLLAFKKHPKHR